MNCKSHRLSCNKEWDVLIPSTEIIIISIIIFIPVCYSIMWSSQKTVPPQLCIYRLNLGLKDKAEQDIRILGLNRIIQNISII